MRFLRRRQEAQDHYTALDIGTEYIKALILRREGDNGIVLGVGRQQQSYSDMVSGAVADIQAVIDNCNLALEEAEDMADAIPGRAVIGIAGEQVKGFSTAVTIPREDPTQRINRVELQNTLELVQKRAMREASHMMAEELGMPEVSLKLIHSTITTVRIDGYLVTNPLDFQGRTMEITVFNTFAPLTHIGALQTIAAELDLELIATVAEPFAMARCCATDEVYEFGGIFVDIGGGTTDVALIRNGGIEGTKMFTIGGRVFTKKIASHLGLSFADAEDLKIRYSRGEVSPERGASIKQLMAPDAEVLVNGVALTLQQLAKADRLPPSIYLAGGGSALPEIKAYLEAYPWTDRLPFARPPKVRVLAPADVRNIYDSTGLLLSQQDITPMGLGYQAIQEDEGESDVLYSTMRRLMRAMKV
ncbi:MAG TPA: cell division FtsA domain-containing protein [Candidatus Dormibacteraeota bacterium]|jgi:cell division protein FtsA|nr:cell division FtsA domain-containing protein [Candidatus Dormibacteraeota bacterium]